MALQVKENIVVNEDGTPADYFVFSVNEKINVGNYSSVDTFASLGRYVEDNDESRQEVIDLVEKVLEVKRDQVIELLEKG